MLTVIFRYTLSRILQVNIMHRASANYYYLFIYLFIYFLEKRADYLGKANELTSVEVDIQNDLRK